MCFKAAHPVGKDILKAMEMDNEGITVGAVCVYPNRVADCVKYLKAANRPDIPVASVATGFPTGQVPLKTRLEEIKMAVADGAKEIDIVINRQFALEGNWRTLKVMNVYNGGQINRLTGVLRCTVAQTKMITT